MCSPGGDRGGVGATAAPPAVLEAEAWASCLDADTDENGKVTLHELKAAVRRWHGAPVPKAEIRKYFGQLDLDASGDLSFQEFLLV